MEGKDESVTFEVRKVDLIPTKKRSRCDKNVLKKMKDCCDTRGPMSVLFKCVEKHLRAKIWTRGSCHIRGICTAFIVAFDKHWNLALVDVDELYVNPLYNKERDSSKKDGKLVSGKTKPREDLPKSNVDNASHSSTMQTDFLVQKIGRDGTSSRLTENERYIKRHMPQMLIRGDNVVLVAIQD